MRCKIAAYCYVNYTSIMQIYINKYVCLSIKNKIANGCQVSKFDKCMLFYITKIQDFEYKLYITCKDSDGISNA